MRQPYRDLYALFRHEPEAEAYFNSLPSYAQEQLSASYQAVDSMEPLCKRQDGASRLLGAGAGGDGYGHPQGLPKRRHRFRDGNISAIYQGQEILLTIK